MPHVLENLAYARACLRKRPFESKESAMAERSEDFDAYHCRYCGKWHRTSKPHLKASIRQMKLRDKNFRKARALRKRALSKYYD